MSSELVGAKLILHRTEEERLRRIEGQIRGLIEMIDADRHCGDELQPRALMKCCGRTCSLFCALRWIRPESDNRTDPHPVSKELAV